MKTKFYHSGGFGFSTTDPKTWDLDKGELVIRRKSFSLPHDITTPYNLEFKRVYLINKMWWQYTYELNDMMPHPRYYLIKLGWFKRIRFLLIQQSHWLQKEKNLRYVVNILFLIIGTIIAWKGLS